jgi:gliding motility-associated-like protein
MMLKHSLCLFLAASMCLIARAQSFSKFLPYSDGQWSEGWIAPSLDNGCFVVSSDIMSRFQVSRLSATGEVMWSGMRNTSNNVSGIVQDDAGDIYLLFTQYAPLNNGIVLAKYTASGQAVWERKLGLGSYSGSHTPLQFHDGRIYMACTANERQRLVVVDSETGQLIWSRSFENTYNNPQDDITKLLVLKDGSVILSVLSEYFSNDKLFRSLVHFDKNGNLIQTRSALGFVFFELAEMPDGNIAFAAHSNQIILGANITQHWSIGILAPDFTVLHLKKVNLPRINNITGIYAQPDNTFSAIIHTTNENCVGTTNICRFTQTCDLVWAKAYSGAIPSIETIKTADSGLIWESFVKIPALGVMITKVDQNGQIASCPTYVTAQIPLKDTTQAFTPLSWSAQVATDWQETGVTPLVPANQPLEDYCYTETLDIQLSVSADTVCVGQTVEAVATQVLGNIYWEIGANGSLGKKLGIDTIQVVFAATGTYPILLAQKLLGCIDSTTRSIQVLPEPVVTLEPLQHLCPGDSLELTALSNHNISYHWSNGSTTPTTVVTAPGWYTLTVQDDHCKAEKSVEIIAALAPEVALGGDVTPCLGSPFRLLATVSEDVKTINWSDGSDQSSLEVNNSGVYSLSVTNSEGCATADTIDVQFQECPPVLLYVPNVFSPSSNGDNQLFTVSSQSIVLEELCLYDRWGNLLFQTRQEPFVWDGLFNGQPVSPGVYVYKIRYRDIYSTDSGIRSGDVTVVR